MRDEEHFLKRCVHDVCMLYEVHNIIFQEICKLICFITKVLFYFYKSIGTKLMPKQCNNNIHYYLFTKNNYIR